MAPIKVGNNFELTFVALGRIDGRPIFQVKEQSKLATKPINGGEGAGMTLVEALMGGNPSTVGGYDVIDIDTVKALEDFIPGFTGAGMKNGDPMSATAGQHLWQS